MKPVYTLGVDVGSTASKTILLEGGARIAGRSLVPLGAGTSGPARAVEEVLAAADLRREDMGCIVSTGYGRAHVEGSEDSRSELSCHAAGAVFLCPGVRTVIDIGGQDTKALQLSAAGILERFVMNDKCAAGTGRFLEVMARILEADMGELAELDERSRHPVSISSTCTVFAESEVISRLSDGAAREDIVRGIHDSIAARAAGLCARLQVHEPVFLSGGLSRDQGLVRALERRLGCPVETAELSVYAGALGAALLAYRRFRRQEREAQNG